MTSILKVDTIQDQSGHNIINENADTITIGASGDTITIPSGATIDASGATLTLPTTIEVDTIEPQSGTTLTLGASGDTINIPSGATLTNNGTATGFGKLLQVVQTVKSDTFSSSSATFVDITGLSASITPSSASNKILVMVSLNIGSNDSGLRLMTKLFRDSTAVFIGDTAGSRERVAWQGSTLSLTHTNSINNVYLDSPSTTSSITYKIQGRDELVGYNWYINRNGNDIDNSTYGRGASSITLIEIAG